MTAAPPGPAPPWEKSYPPGITAAFTPPRETMCELFTTLVARHGERIAIDYRDTLLSYRALGERAARVANALRARGIGKGATVALYLPNTGFHPVFFFGILLTGARVTQLSPLDGFRDLAFKCEDSEARLVMTLTTPHLRDNSLRLLAEGVVPALVFADEDAAFGPAANAPPAPPLADLPAGAETLETFLGQAGSEMDAEQVMPEDVALLQYTGGTTGRPKAAMHTHGSLTASAHIYVSWFRHDPAARPGAVVLVVLPLFHVMALTAIMVRRLVEGARLLIHQRFDVNRVLDDIERKRINGFSGVPTMWIAIAGQPDIAARDLSSLERIASGGAPLPVEVYNRVLQLTGMGLRGGWGMTETASAGTNVPTQLPEGKEATVGLPMPGIELDIVATDDPDRVLPPGETGEMRIRAPNIAIGYWKRPEETAEAFRNGYFLTGDIGSMDRDGYFYLLDRKKDMIISGGYNVYPQAVENAIIEHPAVAEVMVIGVPDGYRGEAAKAFIILKPAQPAFTLDALRAFLAERLGRHEMPQHLEFRSELPKTPVGKYSRKLLRDQELARPLAAGA